MPTGLQQTTAPTSEPLTLTEVKNHLRIDNTDSDDELTLLLAAARSHVETRTNRQLMQATYELTLDRWPSSGVLTLRMPPLSSVTSVVYYDENGSSQTFSSDNYHIRGQSHRTAPRHRGAYQSSEGTRDRMRAGRLKHRVTIETPGGTASTFGEVAQTWSTVATVWAAVEPTSSRERVENEQTKTFTTHRVLMRYRDDVSTVERVTFGSRTLNIQSIINPNEQNATLELLCTEVG